MRSGIDFQVSIVAVEAIRLAGNAVVVPPGRT